MDIQESITINAPLEHVFVCVTERVPEWSPTITRREPLDESYPAVGSRFQSEVNHGGDAGRIRFDGRVTVYERPHAMVYRLSHQFYDIETGLMCDDRTGATVVTQRSSFIVTGWLGWIYRLAEKHMLKAVGQQVRRELTALKQYCEQERSTNG